MTAPSIVGAPFAAGSNNGADQVLTIPAEGQVTGAVIVVGGGHAARSGADQLGPASPSGWEAGPVLDNAVTNEAGDLDVGLWVYRQGAVPISSATFKGSGSGRDYVAYVAYAVTGVDPTTALDVVSAVITGADPPAVTTTGEALVIAFAASRSSSTATTPPSGYGSLIAAGGTDTNPFNAAMVAKAVSVAGSENPGAIDVGGGGGVQRTLTVALRAVASGGTPQESTGRAVAAASAASSTETTRTTAARATAAGSAASATETTRTGAARAVAAATSSGTTSTTRTAAARAAAAALARAASTTIRATVGRAAAAASAAADTATTRAAAARAAAVATARAVTSAVSEDVRTSVGRAVAAVSARATSTTTRHPVGRAAAAASTSSSTSTTRTLLARAVAAASAAASTATTRTTAAAAYAVALARAVATGGDVGPVRTLRAVRLEPRFTAHRLEQRFTAEGVEPRYTAERITPMQPLYADDPDVHARYRVDDADGGLNDFTPTVKLVKTGAELAAVWVGEPSARRVLQVSLAGLEANVGHPLRLVNPEGNDVPLDPPPYLRG